MGNLLAVVVHAANIHDTKSGILAARKAFEKYPTIQRFCADAGYRKTFEQDVSQGNLLAVVVHAANIHDTKSGILAARKAFEKYPTIQRFCADAGYRKTFEQDVSQELGLGVDIVARTEAGWQVLPKRWIVERSLAWINNSRRLSKDYEVSVRSAQAVCTIAAFSTLLKRF